MRILNNLKRFLLGIFLLIFIVLFVGGWVYYTNKFPGNLGMCALITLQNCMESLLFNPILPMQDIVEDVCFWENANIWQQIIMIIYGVVMFVAPLIEVLIVFSILDGFLHLFVGIAWNKKRVLIIGYNEQVRRILQMGPGDSKIYLWTESILSAEEERELSLHNVSVIMNDFSLGDNPDKYNKQLKKFNKILHNRKITNILLLDDSDARNIQYYMALSSCMVCKKRTIHFFVLNNNFESRNALQDDFEYKLKENYKSAEKKTDPSGVDTHMDLKIFNFSQIQAEVLFQKQPLYLGAEDNENMNVHLLIVGGGHMGEQILLHAMNQGVLTENNEIWIDVIDKDTNLIRSRLNKRFKSDYVNKTETTFEIDSSKSDGCLKIRLNEVDIYDDNFEEILMRMQTVSCGGSFTYAVVCLPDVDSNLHCALVFERTIVSGKKIPVAFRMAYLKQLKEYFEHFSYCLSVYLMGEAEKYIGVEQIINSNEEKRIRKYNAVYNSVMDSKIFEIAVKESTSDVAAERNWNGMDYYQRQSNRALFYHQKVKVKMYKDIIKEELNAFWKIDTGDVTIDKDLFWSNRLIEANKDGKANYPLLIKYAKTEHRRWNYFYASEGWTYSKKGKNPKEREHDCLCTWDELVQNKRNMLIYDLISTPQLMNNNS